MKKIIALLLAAVMCLSLAACGGGEKPNTTDTSGIQQGEQLGGEIADNNDIDNSDDPEVDFVKILMNGNCFWSCVNRNGAGFGFIEDGTTVNPDGTWELVDNTVTITLEDGSSDSYEIKEMNGAYYLVGNHDILHGMQISTEDIPSKKVEITMDNWQEYFEFVSASEEKLDQFGEPTGEVEEAHCLKLKDEYYKYFIYVNSDVRIRYTYNGNESDDIMSENYNKIMGVYFGVRGIDSELNFDEMVKVQGTLYFVDGI